MVAPPRLGRAVGRFQQGLHLVVLEILDGTLVGTLEGDGEWSGPVFVDT